MKNALLLKKKARVRKRKRKKVYLFSPRVINGKDRQYVFNFPLLSIMSKENGHYVIENSMLSIFGVGRTRTEAMRDFAEVFDDVYRWYGELQDEALTPKMLRIKTMLNSTVRGVIVAP
ncbi:hypothetical protein [Chitinophaga sp. CF418]|uniref:hypothetical protein n=1 Tax=Chitinophaga sp. CF418 TaxID=1855287 RepID=UPI000911B6C6|nr:hypothetical protein [Chitinophaga sp. CF418]SHN43795.1 hypothetical protein SAMN05216311_11654 [Chitinophaga sp. CF418]